MLGYSKIKAIRAYCDYVEEHLQNIEKAWKVIQAKCKSEKFIWDDHCFWLIDGLVERHDLSKFSPEEFTQYQQKFHPDNPNPSAQEKELIEDNFSKAWEHHKEYNPHHWENWAGKEYYHPHEAICHCVCMIIDWMAMGYKFNDTAESYYLKNRHRIGLTTEWHEFCMRVFKLIKED